MESQFLNHGLRSACMALAAALAVLIAAPALASSEGGGFQQPANNDVANTASLQRGARNFVNYCQGCHSAKYVRYNQLAREFKKHGVDEIICVSVNDAFVMNEWQEDQEAWNIRFLPDGSLLTQGPAGTSTIAPT